MVTVAWRHFFPWLQDLPPQVFFFPLKFPHRFSFSTNSPTGFPFFPTKIALNKVYIVGVYWGGWAGAQWTNIMPTSFGRRLQPISYPRKECWWYNIYNLYINICIYRILENNVDDIFFTISRLRGQSGMGLNHSFVFFWYLVCFKYICINLYIMCIWIYMKICIYLDVLSYYTCSNVLIVICRKIVVDVTI